MKIDHVAVWVDDLEKVREFYVTYFGANSGEKYINLNKKYESYFITFKEGGARIEIMTRPDIAASNPDRGTVKGLAHLAFSVGGRDNVDQLTMKFREDGYKIVGEPRVTGDGYYESVILDPEGNYLEITE